MRISSLLDRIMANSKISKEVIVKPDCLITLVLLDRQRWVKAGTLGRINSNQVPVSKQDHFEEDCRPLVFAVDLPRKNLLFGMSEAWAGLGSGQGGHASGLNSTWLALLRAAPIPKGGH